MGVFGSDFISLLLSHIQKQTIVKKIIVVVIVKTIIFFEHEWYIQINPQPEGTLCMAHNILYKFKSQKDDFENLIIRQLFGKANICFQYKVFRHTTTIS